MFVTRRVASILRHVYVSGAGLVPVTRGHAVSLEGMGGAAIRAALQNAKVAPDQPTAMYVGNMMSGILSQQQHLGPLLATASHLGNIETLTAEACCGSGGAALRLGFMAVASGLHETVVVAGVEHMTHTPSAALTQALATASHWPSEGAVGATFVSLNAALMDLYMNTYHQSHAAFAPLALTAHRNAQLAVHAVFHHKPLDFATFEAAKTLTSPVQLFDASPTCDGAAAVVLTSRPPAGSAARVRILASAGGSDILAVHARPEPLRLRAVSQSTQRALAQAKMTNRDIDIFELHDAYTIMACLSLEAAGFVAPGYGLDFAASGAVDLGGSLPIATFGGLKARGHPVGATGVYQAVEAYWQLTQQAGGNQVPNTPRVAMLQNIGGAAASVFTHILGAE